MKDFRLLFACLFMLLSWTGATAQTDEEYEAALAAMKDGTNYRITTEIGGTKYYVTTAGQLTTVKADGGIFDITKKTGGAFKTTGFRIHGNGTFTNPPLSNNVANLTPGSFSVSSGNNDRDDWERQVLFLNAEGKYAIRSCNTAPATSSWGDAGRTFWTYGIDPVTPQYSYDPAYVWNFEELLASVNVTYEVWDGENKVGSATVIQDANSEVSIPRNLVGLDFNGGYQPKAYYTFTLEEGSTIGDTDCTIKITRTPANGVVHALTDLSNNKAYTIMCDRGTLLTKDGAIASTSHATLHDAAPANFAIISFEDYHYLYSVADKKFVLNDGSLSDLLAHDTLDAIRMTAQTDPYFLYTFKIDDTTFHGFNTNGTGALNGCVIDGWTTPDQGDQYYMIEAADFDPTEALAALDAFFHPAYFVTYVVKDTKGNVLLTSQPQPTSLGAHITTLPEDFQRPFTEYNEVDVTVSDQNTIVEFTATWDGPFELSNDYASAHWYNMTIRSSYYVVMDETEPYYPKTETDLTASESLWAFAGDVYSGIIVYNKAAGDGYTLTKDGNNAVMRAGTYSWVIGSNDDGFTLKESGTDYNCINQNGGSNGPLQFWNSSGSLTDNGSTFRVVESPKLVDLAQDSEGYYLIGTVADWKAFAAFALDNPTANARMIDDIDLGDDQTMIGAIYEESSKYYQGHFDGQGHTLTVNYVYGWGVAPFRFVTGATIENLHVIGRMEAIESCGVGGIVYQINSGATTTICRCWSSAMLISTVNGNPIQTIGGIFANSEGYTLIEDCLFDGQFGEYNTYFNGGFAANVYGGMTIRNSLNLGSYNDEGYTNGAGTFYRPDEAGDNISLENAYFKNVYGAAQGTQVTDEQLMNGDVVTLLQNGRSDNVWVQGDAYPVLNYNVTDIVKNDPEPYAVLSDNNTVLTFYYDDKKATRGGLSVGPFDNSDNQSWKDYRVTITKVVFDTSFAGCTSITSTACWLYGCLKLTEIIGIENLNTANVTDMGFMFYDCSSLTSLDVGNFNTESVTNMLGMFCGCSSLKSLDVGNFNTESVTTMWEMFCDCSSLTSLDLSNFNTANVTDMRHMFCFCSNLTSLDLSSFNTASVTYMTFMFDSCSSLKSLDLSNFNTANVTDMRYMFYGSSKLSTIYVGNGWSTASVTSGDAVFTSCSSLVGGNGTKYDANHIDYTYAHIDGGSSNPGYFTAKDGDLVTLRATNYSVEYGEPMPAFDFTSEGAAVEGEPQITCEAVQGSSVGTYPIVISKGGVTNYNDQYVNGTLTITKAPLTVGFAEAYNCEEGEPIPVFEIVYSGWKLNETEEVLTEKPVATTTATVASRAGTYPITISGGSAQNYELNYEPGTLTIVALPLSMLGDVNRDGKVSVGDIVLTVNHLLGQNPSPFNVRLADANDDGDVDAADLVEEVNLIAKSFVAASTAVKWQWTEKEEQLTGYLHNGELSIQLEDATPYTAFQMTLTVPEGIDIDDVKAKLLRRVNHQLGIGKLNENQLRVIGYSMDNLPFTGQTGTLLEIKGLDGDILMDDILFVSPSGQKRHFAPISISPATGIVEGNNERMERENSASTLYDITGRPMSRKDTKSGLYINNGKKMMIR